MLVARHPMRVALALISTMLSLAGIYALLGVHVVAVFQVLIYVGAVMVFMVYVIMLLDVRDPSFIQRYGRGVWPGIVLGALLFCALLAAGTRLQAPGPLSGVEGLGAQPCLPISSGRSRWNSCATTGCTSSSLRCCSSRPSSRRSP